MPEGVTPITVPTPYPIGPVTLYLVDGDPLTLIDTGPATRTARAALRRALARSGRRPEDVARVLVTHGHHDHFGLARWLQRHGAEIHAHPHDRDNLALRRRPAFLWHGLAAAGFPAAVRVGLLAGLGLLDRTARSLRTFQPLRDGDVLPGGSGGIRVHHLPGHSPGHVGFELLGEAAAVTGDLLLDGVTPNAVVDVDPVTPGRPFASVAAYGRSLQRLEELAPAVVLPAHGPCIADVSEQIAVVRRRQDERRRQLVGALAGGPPATVAELVGRLFPGSRLLTGFLAYSEVFGQLMELERRGEVERLKGRRRERWRAVAAAPRPVPGGGRGDRFRRARSGGPREAGAPDGSCRDASG